MRNVLLFDLLLPGVVVSAGEGVEVMAGARAVGGTRAGRAVGCAIDLASGRVCVVRLRQGPTGQRVGFVQPSRLWMVVM